MSGSPPSDLDPWLLWRRSLSFFLSLTLNFFCIYLLAEISFCHLMFLWNIWTARFEKETWDFKPPLQVSEFLFVASSLKKFNQFGKIIVITPTETSSKFPSWKFSSGKDRWINFSASKSSPVSGVTSTGHTTKQDWVEGFMHVANQLLPQVHRDLACCIKLPVMHLVSSFVLESAGFELHWIEEKCISLSQSSVSLDCRCDRNKGEQSN